MFVIVTSGACIDGGSDVDVELGRIQFYDDGPLVEVQSSARVGQAIHISVITYGGGCIDHARTDVEQSSERVEIYPFDTRPPTDAICTLELRHLDHSTTFTFATAGVKTVEVFGRRVDQRVDEMISVPFSIDVSP
jgi:hypothetical protein